MENRLCLSDLTILLSHIISVCLLFIMKTFQAMNYRIEIDTMGEIRVPADKYWGAQTQRSLLNFPIGPPGSMPVEVIANRAHVLLGNKLGSGERLIHPNDDANRSQSSNDTFTTAMNMAAYRKITGYTIPEIERLARTLSKKSAAMSRIVKIGRTHMMDATPLTFGQEFSGFVSQLKHGIRALKNTLSHLSELAIGGTAVGTGLNSPRGFDREVVTAIAGLTGLPFVPARNKFESLAANDSIVETHGAIKQLAVCLTKIANDIRLMASGPRSGLGEITIPANEPGSSIMPGKVNPTQTEAVTMVCAQIIGNDTTITIAGSNGHFELNVFKPVMISALLQSATLIADACRTFNDFCIAGIEPNQKRIAENLKNSLMLVTALNNHIGYENAARIADEAYTGNLTLKEAAVKLRFLTEEEFDRWVNPAEMIRPMKRKK